MKTNVYSIQKKLDKYLNSDKFQQRLKKDLAGKFSTGSPYSQSYVKDETAMLGWSMYEINAAVTNFKKFLCDCISESVFAGYSGQSILEHMSASEMFTYTKISHIKYHPMLKDRIISCEVNIGFSEKAKHRNSFKKSRKYPNGVDNIFKLLTNGWDARRDLSRAPVYNSSGSGSGMYGALYGMWHGKHTRALVYREGNDELFRIVEEYNGRYQKKGQQAYVGQGYNSKLMKINFGIKSWS